MADFLYGSSNPPPPPNIDATIYLLGPPSAQFRGQPVEVGRAQVRALLYYLAYQDTPVTNERLCFLFFPDRSDREARHLLSHLLSHLRQAIQTKFILLLDGSSVSLHTGQYWTDVKAFRSILAKNTSSNQIEVLKQAVELYRGPLLEGFNLPSSSEYEKWMEQERADLEFLYLTALLRLVKLLTRFGDHDQAINYARSYLEIDEMNEEIHRLLIQLYTYTGFRKEAIQQYKCCVEVLDNELGIRPLPETFAAYQEAMNSCSTPKPNRPILLSQPALSQKLTPIVGRHKELICLEKIAENVFLGKGNVVFINGESGIGKTRLLREFALRKMDEFIIANATCFPGTQSISFHPISQILRELFMLKPDLFEVSHLQHGYLAEVLPELRPNPISELTLGEPARPAHTKEIFEELISLFYRFENDTTLVALLFDDMHWIDPDTLDWLNYLVVHMHNWRLLLIGAYCCRATSGMSEFFHRLTESGHVYNHIKLNGLTKANIEELIQYHTGFTVDNASLEKLVQITGGNPLYVQEIIKGYLESEESFDNFEKQDQLPIPDTIWRAILSRTGRLLPDTLQVLERAAFLPIIFTASQICRISGLPEFETIHCLEELISRELLIEDRKEYQFRHSMIRTAVRLNMSEARRDLIQLIASTELSS